MTVSIALALALAGASAAAAASPDQDQAGSAIEVPASWEGSLTGAEGTVRWHLDLLPEQRYRLRRTYEDNPTAKRFDEIGRWRRAPDTPRLELLAAGGKRIELTIEPDGSLRRVDADGNPTTSGPGGRLQRLPQPALIEPRVKTSGLFIYMADAAVITLCADGSRMPVAMAGGFRALQAAYQKARPAPGEALLARVEGRIVSRPSMEESLPPRDTLVVDRFISLSAHGSCGGAQ
jgi:copper homeostasis protein (lipoprotein)